MTRTQHVSVALLTLSSFAFAQPPAPGAAGPGGPGGPGRGAVTPVVIGPPAPVPPRSRFRVRRRLN